jgi:hypothetical protein
MSVGSRPKGTGNIPVGAVGLLFTIVFCVGIAVFEGRLYVLILECVLGVAGLVISIAGIAKGSGRIAGIFGILAFILGGLMTFTVILDMIAHARGHSE